MTGGSWRVGLAVAAGLAVALAVGAWMKLGAGHAKRTPDAATPSTTAPAARGPVVPVLFVPTSPTQRPTGRTADCTSVGCHAEQIKFKVKHGPVQIGSCESCHTYRDEAAHTFKLRGDGDGGTMCTFCHIGGGGPAGVVTHKPFEDGQCLTCHNPHGGSTRVLLRTDDLASLCASCHGDITRKRKNLHGPVATGSCAACHQSHRSNAPKLLTAEGRTLCLSCHDQMDAQIRHAKVLHKPLTEGACKQCHEVHASDHVRHLKEEPRDLCLSCHENVRKQIAGAAVKHSAATTGDACLTCHTAHGGALTRLMKAEPAKACLSCHDKAIEVAAAGAAPARTVAAMANLGDATQNRHGPLRDGDCSGCHLSHGSSEAHLLAKPYSPAFYQPFAIEKYDLCFTCHDRELVLRERTDTLTGFRNGPVNLHFVHVNRDEKGRNCRACHSTHTSARPVHMRESVPYGQWDLPIGFEQTKAGGACSSACHERFGYDREKPVDNSEAKARVRERGGGGK